MQCRQGRLKGLDGVAFQYFVPQFTGDTGGSEGAFQQALVSAVVVGIVTVVLLMRIFHRIAG